MLCKKSFFPVEINPSWGMHKPDRWSSPDGNVGWGEFHNPGFTARSLGRLQGSHGMDPICIPTDFAIEHPSHSCQGVSAGSPGLQGERARKFCGIKSHRALHELLRAGGMSNATLRLGEKISKQSCIPAGTASGGAGETFQGWNDTSKCCPASQIEGLVLFTWDRSKLGLFSLQLWG